MTPRPAGLDNPNMTADEQLLNRAALRFEMLSTPKQEVPESWYTESKAAEWRKDPRFNMNPATANYSFSLVTSECRAALEDGEFAVKHGLASTPKRAPFRYTPAEKVALEQLLTGSIYPQINALGLARFKEEFKYGSATNDLLEVSKPLRTKMQDIALLRDYLNKLCKELNAHSDTNFTSRELTFAHVRKQADALLTHEDLTTRNLAKEMLDVADYVKRETIALAAGVNEAFGKPILEKENIVTLESKRGR